MKEKEEIQNVYAYNLKFEEIHISQAESGRKGYLCRGCQREMQAVKQTRPNLLSYFRHDHNAIKGLPKCTYSDETYRHSLAKKILLRIFKIKVPALFKYPPENETGKPNLIAEAKIVEADFVEEELFFYESETGERIWSKSIFNDNNKFLLSKPDIIFFDKNYKPILLKEIVATHKVTENKKLDLKRLGIDTIQITIPKDSPENIEKIFETTDRTEWIYNYEQENTEYIQISDTNTEGIIFRNINGKKILLLFILTNIIYVFMLTVTIPKVMGFSGGMKLLDMIPTGYNVAYVNSLLTALGEQGRHAYLFNQIPFDMIYPLLFGVSYCLILAFIFKKLGKLESPLFYLCFLPLFAGFFDYSENIGIIALLTNYPNNLVILAQVTNVFSVLKSSFTTIYFIVLIIFLIILARKKFLMKEKAC